MTGGGNTLPSSGTRLPPSRSAPRLPLGPRGSILHVSHPWLLGALSSPAPHRSGGPRGLGPHVPQVPTPQLWCRPPDPQLEGHLSGAPHTLALCWAPVVAGAQFAVAGLSDGAPHSGPEPRTPGGPLSSSPPLGGHPVPRRGFPPSALPMGKLRPGDGHGFLSTQGVTFSSDTCSWVRMCWDGCLRVWGAPGVTPPRGPSQEPSPTCLFTGGP